MGIYDSIFYGAGGSFYGPSDTDVPTDLRFYRTNVDNVYVFHWGFQEAFITPLLSTLDYDLQLDSVPTFDSPDLTQFDSLSAISYQNGDVRKGFAVPVPTRLDKTEQTWYARVRSKTGFVFSAWSLILQFTIVKKWELEEAEALLNNLPDYHVYNKEDLIKDVSQRSTKLYKVCNMYSRELDQNYLEDTLTKTNNYISLCRDEQLFDNFGTFFNYEKPQTQQFVEYRMCLLNLILGSLVGATEDAVERVIKCFTGVNPIIELIRERNDFFLTTELETPTPTPNGVAVDFTLTSDYVTNSLVVLKNGVIQTNGVDYTENHSLPGFTMAVAPLIGDTLQAFFDVGSSGQPDPVVFDLSDTVALTGSVTFTNNSQTVTGVGTLFLSEVTPGMILTDSSGLIFGVVTAVASNTSLSLEDPWIGSTGVSSPAYKVNFNGTISLTGSVTFTNGSSAVTGVGTAFLSQLQVGDTIIDDTGLTQGIVSTIASNTSLTLTANWAGSTGVSINARKLVYTEPLLWDRGTLAYGFIIRVVNPGLFILDRELIEQLVRPLLPAHCKVFFDFE